LARVFTLRTPTMAALAVALPLFSRPQLTRPLLARPLFSSLFAFSTPFAFAAVSASRAWSLSFPSLQSLLELFPPFVLAVPKSKVSHSRKSMREANKGLKDKHSASCTVSVHFDADAV
jgi:large subunit ribosomal protein L32